MRLAAGVAVVLVLAVPAGAQGPAVPATGPGVAGLRLSVPPSAGPCSGAARGHAPAIEYSSRSALPPMPSWETGWQVHDPVRGTVASIRVGVPFPHQRPAERPTRALSVAPTPCAGADGWNDTRWGVYSVSGARPRGRSDSGYDAWSERRGANGLRAVGR